MGLDFTITGQVTPAVEQVLLGLDRRLDETGAEIARVAQSIPAPLTLDQIRSALGPTGATPLNIFQLVGQSTTGLILIGTHLQRLAKSAAVAGDGAVWYETDRHALYYVQRTTWTLLGSFGMPGTLNGPDEKPTDLVAADQGFLFQSTDFRRVYRWTATAWEDAPGQPPRGFVWVPYSIDAAVFAPGTGYQLCDGTVNVRISKPDGTTTLITVPDLTSRFLRGVTGATGGTGGSATTHTHAVDPPSTASSIPSSNTTSTPSSTQEVQSGAGVTVASLNHQHDMANHTHTVDVASFASGVPSGTGGDDALPPYYNARVYVRL